MGVGLPFGVGAKVAKPDKQVIVVHGDGSFGMNAMELDTAVRHKIPILVVISLNGGWTADSEAGKARPRSWLHTVRQDGRGAWLPRGGRGAAGRHPSGILVHPQRKVDEGMVALVNVKTDYRARYAGPAFSDYSTIIRIDPDGLIGAKTRVWRNWIDAQEERAQIVIARGASGVPRGEFTPVAVFG